MILDYTAKEQAGATDLGSSMDKTILIHFIVGNNHEIVD